MPNRSPTPWAIAWMLCLCLLLSTASAQDAPAPALPEGVTPVASVEGITEYRLPNGLRVLLFPDPTKPTVTVNITYLVGSRHEGYGETGMAHLLEHLMFKGTPGHPDIPAEMKRRGVAYNATTWLDRTNYFSTFTYDEATLDWLLAMEADRMRNSHISADDLASEMTVVRNEMESGENNPIRVLMSRIVATAFLWHNYGNSTIGARADVENMPIEALRAFYHRHYRPDNATLLVAGRFEPADVLGRIVETFGAIPTPDAPLPQTYTRDPDQDGEREINVRRSGETRYLGTLYHVPAGRHPDTPAIAVLGNVLGDTPTGRLHQALVEGGLATFVGSVNYALDEPGYMMFLAEAPQDGDFDALERQLIELVENVEDTPVTEQEVADAKRRFAKATEQTINDANRLATALSESIAQGDWRLFFVNRDRIEDVTAAEVNRVAAEYLVPSNRTLGRFLPTENPERAEITPAPPASELVEGYVGREAVAAGEAFDPSPANIEERTIRTVLSNGTELVMLPKETRGDTVRLALQFRFGALEDVIGKDEAASFVASMLTRGSRNLSREDIARRLDELNAQLSIGGDAQTVTVSAQTTREHLPALVVLVAELLKTPSFPADEFEQLRRQAITGVQSAMTEPQALAGNAMNRHFNRWPEGHPYRVKSFDEQLAALRAVTREQVAAFHSAFYGAGDGEIAVVGDFDPTAVNALFERQFGDWTRPVPFERIDDPYRPVEPVAERILTPDKANAVWMTGTELPISDTDPDYPALVAGNYILGGGSLKSRLADRIRQQEGLSYSVASQFSAHPIDRHGSLLAFAIAAPDNVPKVDAAFRDELDKLLEDGVTEAELRDAIAGLIKARQQGRAEDANLAAQLRSNAYLDRTMEWSAELEQALAGLTVDEVNEALRERFGDAGFSTFTAGDFEKAAVAPELAPEEDDTPEEEGTPGAAVPPVD